MLCLSLHTDNEIHFRTKDGEEIIVRLNDRSPRAWYKANGCRLVIDAPKSVNIYRRPFEPRTASTEHVRPARRRM